MALLRLRVASIFAIAVERLFQLHLLNSESGDGHLTLYKGDSHDHLSRYSPRCRTTWLAPHLNHRSTGIIEELIASLPDPDKLSAGERRGIIPRSSPCSKEISSTG